MPPSLLSDAALLAEAVRAAGLERRATADLVALLAEVDTRRLYLGQSYPSLFAWCTGALHLSEPAAYGRITAARTARRYPAIVKQLADGSVTLTTVTLLAAHLTDENHEALLDAARHKSKRDIERLVASLVPQPDITSTLRRLPASFGREPTAAFLGNGALSGGARSDTAASDGPTGLEPRSANAGYESPARLEPLSAIATPKAQPHERRPQPAPSPHAIAALASDRYLLRITLSAEARARLDRARDLLRPAVPTGDPAVIVDRALTVLVEKLEAARCAAARRPQPRPRVTTARRHVPAAVRRAVWIRDEGRCAFVGADGRCRETGWLEIHHVVPFARGGPATVANLALRCRTHNAYEAEQEFGLLMPSGPFGRPRASEGARPDLLEPSASRPE